jgi:6-phosphogluconolactonase
MLKKAAALFVVSVSLATWTSCGKNVSRFLYAAIPGANQIEEFRQDPNTGILTALSGSPIPAGPAVESVVIHPSNKFLYAANSGEGDISLFTIAVGGALTEVTPRTTVGNGITTPLFLAMDSAGSFLYVGSTGISNAAVSVFSIDAGSGALSPVSGSPFQIGIPPTNMALSPNGSSLYVLGAGAPQGFIEVWSITSGALSQLVQIIQPGANPSGIAIDPSGSFLYVANTTDNSISEYSMGSTGVLTELQQSSPLGQSSQYSGPVSLLVDNSGKFLYVANSGTSNLSAYAIGSDGSLTILSTSPFATSSQPNFIATDVSGKHLYVGNQASSAIIQAYNLDTGTGALTSLATYGVGNTPKSIVVSH